MASGRPVIAYRKGGVTETVVEGKTGVFFDEQTADSIAEAVRKFKDKDFDPKEIRAYAEKFSVKRFQDEIMAFINDIKNKQLT
jgi:glycosyltransferase involved in cell wall biosynthesis